MLSSQSLRNWRMVQAVARPMALPGRQPGRERATVLIATTKAFAGQRFSPISQDGLEVIRLEDPEEAARDKWARSKNVVVYLRALSKSG